MDLNHQSGLFPFRQWTFAPKVCLLLNCFRIRSLLKVSKMYHPPSFHSALPQGIYQERSTSIDFAENQLFPSLISLSPLSSNHPSILQHTRVRSFTVCYHNSLNLFKLRSLGFGFASVYWSCILVLGLPSLAHLLKLAHTVNSLTHYTKGRPLH